MKQNNIYVDIHVLQTVPPSCVTVMILEVRKLPFTVV